MSLRKRLVKDSSKPVVAVITPGSLPVPPVLGGGIQTVIYEYAIKNKSQNIVIVSSQDAGLPALELDKEGIGHIRIKNKSYHNFELVWRDDYLIRFNWYIYKACRILKELQPDVVHIHNRPHFVPIARNILGNTVKIALTEHNQKIAEDKYVLSRINKIMSSLDMVIDCSKKILELDLLAAFPQYQEKTAVIYNGVDSDFYQKADPETIKKVINKYSLGSQKNILFVGRLVSEKAVDKLLEALPYVLKEEPDAKLVIVGSSFFGKSKTTPFIKKLIKLAEPVKNSVSFTGFVDTEDLPVLYSLADIFASPVNWDDPSPKTIYEAAACETAIVSTKRGGIPEIVVDGDSALLLDSPYEITELADTIVSLLREPETRERLGANGRQRMLENFTTEIIARQWADAYQNLIEQGQNNG